ncbi:S-adenosyl-L-methionine-dependent tRNA 4-demethylwyosine synthase-like, partial [Paramuricea clavata]
YFAGILQKKLNQELELNSKVIDLKNYDPDDSLANEINPSTLCIFILATYTDGQPTEGTGWFYKWLRETAVDFRVQKSLLLGLNYCVLGLGNSLYEDYFNTVSIV